MSSPEPRTLPSPPTDGITSLSYLYNTENGGSSSSLLASTSWDGGLRIHDTSSMSSVLSQNMQCGPVLSLATPKSVDNCVFTGGLDGSVRKLDITTSSIISLGLHGKKDASQGENGCSCLTSLDCSIPSNPMIVASAGWDETFCVWDSRVPESDKNPAVSVSLPGKAFSMDSHQNQVVVATSGRRICIFDVRMCADADSSSSAEMVMSRESSLKYQTRCIRFMNDGKGMALGSIEGRVAIEYLDGPSDSKKKKYAFKCHRINDTVYPVNAIAFHPIFGTFATGGCDGTVVVWDAANKKRLTALQSLPTSVSAMAFNHDGSELAIASSYTFEEGERDSYPRDEIYVRNMLEIECRPKTAK